MRLARLEIEDFALIAKASLDFAAGFTVCTGETGSGKTMLLGALAFVLGERSSVDIVRRGAARARVTLALEPDAAFLERLSEEGFEAERDEPTTLVREMLENGKSSARINGRLATSAQLRTLGALVLDRVGQHEQQKLLSRAYQLDVLDAFAGEAALARRRAVAAAYERAVRLEAEARELERDDGRALAELEFARFASRDIESANPQPGEDDALRERREYLANGERIAAALGRAHAALNESESSALEALGTAAASVRAVANYAPALAELADALGALQSETSEVAGAIAREAEAADFDPAELDAATGRLDALERIKKKYGGSIAEVLEAKSRFETTIARETSRGALAEDARADYAAALATLETEALALGRARAEAARILERRVATELAGLAMPAARFAVVLEPLAQAGPSGAQSVEFALAPNPGEPVRSLARAASGGELARVLLALVVVLADRRERTALVFDEIDAGIGGATAAAVGTRLGLLARASQVLCVTHLAQIASWADRHYALRKRDHAGGTLVELVALEERPVIVEEIARMLSGNTAAVALEHAQSLVRDVRARKARTKLSA